MSQALMRRAGVVAGCLALLLGVAPQTDAFAQAKKPAGKKGGAVMKPVAAKLKPPPSPLEITCGAPVTPPKVEKKRLISLGSKKPKLPEACVLSRFRNPAFPPADPNAAGRSALGLFGGSGLVEAVWLDSLEEFQRVADEIADYGPKPTLRAKIRLSSLVVADARAVYEGSGGTGGTIVLSTKLIEGLTELSEHVSTESAEESDALTQHYVRFIIAHEYAHLVLNHPQQLDKAKKNYEQIGQVLALSGAAYAIGNQLKIDKDASYREREKESRKSAAVFLAASFAGDIAATEGTRFLFPVFNRSVERDADMLAVDIIARVEEGNPVKGVESLKIFRDRNKASIKKNSELANDAKKTSDAAVAQLLLAAPALPSQNQKDLEKQLKIAAALLVAGWAAQKLEEHKMMLNAHLHDSPEDRDALVNDYSDAFYGVERFSAAPKPVSNFAAAAAAAKPASTPAAVAATTKKPTFSKVNFKRVSSEVKGYTASQDAKAAMTKGDLAEARKQIDIALKSPIKATTEVQLLAGAVAQAEGDQDRAIQHFRAVLATGYNNPGVFLNIVESQRFKGDNDAALKTIAEGVTKTGQLDEFILERMDIHRAKRDEKALASDLEACKALQITTLTMRCTDAAAPLEPLPPATSAPAAAPVKPTPKAAPAREAPAQKAPARKAQATSPNALRA